MALTNCLITSGLSLGCRDNLGGVALVAIQNYGSTFSYTLGATANAGMITAFGSTASPFYIFEQELETATFTQTGVFSNENQSAYYEITVEMTLAKLTTDLANTLKLLGQGAFRIIIKDNRGVYWLLSPDAPFRVSAMAGGTGKAYGDLNGTTVTLTTKQKSPAIEVTSAAALTVISA